MVKPGISLSRLAATSACEATEVNKVSELGSIVNVMVEFIVPSIIKSSRELNTMVCVAFQFALLKVTLPTEVLISSVGLRDRLIITSLVGRASKTIVKLAV